jgi:large subunit ribosomal protein L10
MNLQQKEIVVGEVSQRFANATAAYFVNFEGCTCQSLTKLRQDLRPSGASFAIVKNTLIRLAIAGTDAQPLGENLVGPTAVVWTGTDPVAPAKVIAKFAKDQKKFEIKSGIVEGKVVDAVAVTQLAELPSREELLSNLLALINAPAVQLLRTINAPAAQVVRLLGAWQRELEKKGS